MTPTQSRKKKVSRRSLLSYNIAERLQQSESPSGQVSAMTNTNNRTYSDVVPGLVDKALGAARAGTKKKGAELCAMYVEVSNSGQEVMVGHLCGQGWDAISLCRMRCLSVWTQNNPKSLLDPSPA